jgi:hypothetical protein
MTMTPPWVRLHEKPGGTKRARLGAEEPGDLGVHVTQTLREGATDTHQEMSCWGGVLIDEVLHGVTGNAPNLGKLDGSNGGAGLVRIEEVDLANGLATANLAEEHRVPSPHRASVESTGDDEVETVLVHAFLNEVLVLLHRVKLTVAAEETAIIVAKRSKDAKGRKFGSSKCRAHEMEKWKRPKYMRNGSDGKEYR